MTHNYTTVDIISYSITILQIIALVMTIILRRKTKKLIAEMRNRYSEFEKQTTIEYERFTNLTMVLIKKEKEDIEQRMNALSMENAKLYERNDLLKEKLINLGFSEQDLEL